MGKFLETKHSDVDKKILKKQGKNIEQCRQENKYFIKCPLNTIKRKLQILAKKAGPAPKKAKTDTESNSQSLPTDNVPLELEPCVFSNETVEVFQNASTKEHFLRLSNKEFDIFLVDEKQCYFKNYMFDNLIFQVFTEISLEGLEGITLEALWKRLKWALKNNVDIERAKNQIWKIITSNSKVRFYILANARPQLHIYDRFNDTDENLIFKDNSLKKPHDIYPISIVKGDNMGSCASYYERTEEDTVRQMSLTDVEKEYGNQLVIVADLDVRINNLFDETSDPNFKLEPIEYCILERIGRSRRFGEVTQGSTSVNVAFNLDVRTTFHYYKHMTTNNLICRQLFLVRCQVTEQNKPGRLVHLPKFYQFRKNKNMILTEEVVELLKKAPHYQMDIKMVRKKIPECIGKPLKSQEFRKYINTSKVVLYREMYPNARKSEYLCKNSPKERLVQLLVLHDPEANVCWHETDTQDAEEDEPSEQIESTGSRSNNLEPIREIYQYILSKSHQGCSQAEICKQLDIDLPTIRMCLKKLLKANYIFEERVDRAKTKLRIFKATYIMSNYDQIMDCENDESEQKANISILNKLKHKQSEIISKSNKKVYNMDDYLLEHANIDIESDVPSLNFELKDNLICDFLVIQEEIVIKDTLITNWKFEPLEMFMNKPKFNIDLSFKLRKDQIFNINHCLNEIEKNGTNNYYSNINFKNIPENIISGNNKSRYDMFIKLLILKQFFGEIEISSEQILSILGTEKRIAVKRKLTENIEVVPDIVLKENVKKKDSDKLNFMGDEPLTVFAEETSGVHIEITMSTLPQNYVDSSVYPEDKYLTERIYKRLNYILEAVYAHPRVFEDKNKMLKLIVEKELAEGYNKKIDRKSLARLFQKLTSEGFIKIYQVNLSNERVNKSQLFFAHPEEDYTNGVIQNAIEQLKLKYLIGTARLRAVHTKNAPETVETEHTSSGLVFDTRDVMQSVEEFRQLTPETPITVMKCRDRMAAKAFGFRPKFLRMRILHEILFYLIYGSDNNRQQLDEYEVKALFGSYGIVLSDEDLRSMPPIYCNEISWKMFIPPMPKHLNVKEGWALLCDVILRMPLSVMVKLHSVNFFFKELQETLDHPVKRYYLMKDQSWNIRSVVLVKRKYMFTIHEIMCRLAHCGLLQFGPEKYKEKDQTFIYLNRNASLLDTMSSDPGYNMVSIKKYKEIRFYFNSQNDIDSYWYSVYNISMNTKLNQRSAVSGQTITLTDVSAKPDIVRALSAKSQDEVLQYDNGALLGDKRGAAGLDSSLWVHMVRNWFWAHRSPHPPNSSLVAGLNIDCYKKAPEPVGFEELIKITPKLTRKVFIAKKSKPAPVKHSTVKVLKVSNKVKKITRKITIRPSSVRIREYYDAVDRAVVKRNGIKVKVHWTEEENKVLNLLRIVCVFLSVKVARRQKVFYTVLRDVLHRMLPHVSKNKTSHAVQRRLKLWQKKRTYEYEDENARNLLKDPKIFKYFVPFLLELEKGWSEFGLDNGKKIKIAFVILVAHIRSNMSEIKKLLQGNLASIDHFSPENLEYSTRNIEDFINQNNTKVMLTDIENTQDIRKNVLKSVVRSSLSNKTADNNSGIAYQLFKIYQKFSDTTIRDAVHSMRQQQLISSKVSIGCKLAGTIHTPFQLSHYYILSQSVTFAPKTALHAYELFQKIQKSTKEQRNILYKNEDLEKIRYGQMLGLNEICSFWYENVNFKFCFPDNIISLNPDIKDHSEVIEELAKIYLAKLQKEAKNIIEEDQETEINTKDDVEEFQNSALDLTVNTNNSETIDNLKIWVSNCMEGSKERSPSPEFVTEQSQKSKTNAVKEKKPKNKLKVEEKILPTIEEIKEGMMDQKTPSEERTIPYITDLTDLLDSNDIDLADEVSCKLSSHFTTEFPYLDDAEIMNTDEFKESLVYQIVNAKTNIKEIWESIEKQGVYHHPVGVDEYEEILLNYGSTENDLNLTRAIVEFIESKQALGCTGPSIKEKFSSMEDSLALESIITFLVESNIILRTGVCTMRFVHCKYYSIWLVDTFSLSSEQEKALTNKNDMQKIKEDIDKKLENGDMFKARLYPWSKIDGTLNKTILKQWLCNILSHCMEFPNIPMTVLCEKFYHINPVDVYFLIEILKQIGCVEIYVVQSSDADIFSGWLPPTVHVATCLDDFNKIYVDCNPFSITCFGSFLSEEPNIQM